jgi:dTDP-glucose 4,6-dehydratase
MDPTIDQDSERLLEVYPEGANFDNIVVTGSSGMLGQYHVELFAEISRKLSNNVTIHAFSREPTPYLIALSKYYPESIRIQNYEDPFSSIARNGRTHVVHAASPASPESYVGNLQSLVFTNLVLSMDLNKSFSFGNNHLTLFSSGEVYGPAPTVPTSETSFDAFDHLGARGAYPELKRTAELIFLGEKGIDSTSASALRIFHTFGPGVNLQQTRIFSTVLKSLLDSMPIELHSDGSAKRSFMYAGDLAHAVMQLSNMGTSGAFNVGGRDEISILEFSQLASKLVEGTEVSTLVSNQNNIPQATATRGLANTERLNALGWHTLFTTEDALEKTLTSLLWRRSAGLL